MRLVLVLAALSLTGLARAQIRQEILIPGSTESVARVLGLDPAPERSRFMLEVIRALYDQPENVSPEADKKLEALYGYLDSVTALESAIKEHRDGQPGLSFDDAADKHRRQKLEPVLELLGLKLVRRKNIYRVEIGSSKKAARRREALTEVGIDADSIARRLSAGETVSFEIPHESAPLPLPPPVWAEVIFGGPVPKHALFHAIMSDRKAALLYYGLSALNDRTLTFLASHPNLLERLYRDHAATFAVFGRSIVIQDGVIQIPGDARGQSLWSDLVDARIDEPERFIRRLLGRDNGRLAYFYDTVAHLDEPHRAFVLALSLADAGQRSSRFRGLYRAFANSNDHLNLEKLPFKRRAFDAALLLREVTVEKDGRLIGPSWYRLWREAFGGSDLPGNPNKNLAQLDRSEPVDADWLVESVCQSAPQLRRERFEMFLFAQRVFRDRTIEDGPDILLALRGFARHRTLMLTLERMGLTAPALYANAAKRAAGLSQIEDERRATVALTHFQAALALVSRAQLRGVLGIDEVQELVRTLLALELDAERENGTLASWLDGVLLPTLRLAGDIDQAAAADDVLVIALAGSRNEEPTVISWEGMSLRVSFHEPEYQRLLEMRAAQGGNALDSVLALRRLAGTMGEATSLEQLEPLAQKLGAFRGQIESGVESGVEYAISPRDVDKVLTKAVDQLRKMRKEKDLRDISSVTAPVLELSGELLAEVLCSFVYAIHLGHVDGPILITGKLAARHDFGVTVSNADTRKQIPWRLAVEVSNKVTPWHMQGSLLALDLGLARLRLRRLEGAPPPKAPTMTTGDRLTFSRAVALMKPLELSNAERDYIAKALRLGRARVEALASNADDADAIAETARLSEWRRYTLPFVLASDPEDVATYFSITELVWLGQSVIPEDERRPLNAWGSAALPETGCYCLRFPSPEPWEEFAGRIAHGQLAARMPDLNLIVAEKLFEWQLPASLAPSILSFLVLDCVERARPIFADDWHTLSRHALTFSPERIQDYISSLAADGPLRLAEDGFDEDGS